ncbi:MAG: glycosyltransferase [Candidatus Omnitrophica bacterium]|nr:glycosyltransferase [Candidatus Omnitrophota bacterium]
MDQTIKGLLQAGHRVIYQRVVRSTGDLSCGDEKALHGAAAKGVEVLPLLIAPAPMGGRWRRMIAPTLKDLYPETALAAEVESRIRRTGCDVAFIFWNPEGLGATYGIKAVPKFVYYGMPDHSAGENRFLHPELFDLPRGNLLNTVRLKLWIRQNRIRGAFHMRLMRDCQSISNLCAYHAGLYSRMGHPRSLYIQNTWPDAAGHLLAARETLKPMDRFKLMGSLGSLQTTGNTFGLHYLGAEVLPLLRRILVSKPFEIHIYGDGQPHTSVARVLCGPEIRWRGWVPDIDREILSSHLFLIMNNVGSYKGVHTRFLHAWSLESCVVAHQDNARGMPEMRHLENVLLGRTPEEIADWIATALEDAGLRTRIARGGRQTYETHFTPAIVVGKIIRELEHLASGSKAPVPERSYQLQ